MRSWLALVLILALGSVVVFFPRAGWFLGETLRGGSGGAFPPPAPEELRLENAALRARIAALEGSGSAPAFAAPRGVQAFIYSRYPLNVKSEVLVSAGSAAGVHEGDIVATGSCGVLLGKVARADGETAVVRTIFDPSFKLAVRIGDAGVDGLLQGGNAPRVTTIEKKKIVAAGEPIYSASAEAPYGLSVGAVRDLAPAEDDLFMNASLETPYDLNAVRTVCIIRRP